MLPRRLTCLNRKLNSQTQRILLITTDHKQQRPSNSNASKNSENELKVSCFYLDFFCFSTKYFTYDISIKNKIYDFIEMTIYM